MSDSIVAILGVGFIAGIVATIAVWAIYERDYQRQHNTDSDVRLYVYSRDRDRRGDNRHDRALEAEVGQKAREMNIKLGE